MNTLFNDGAYQISLNSSHKSYYRMLLVLSSLTPLKIKILLILAHLSPKRLSATQLTALLGYSKSSRIIYRGVLEELQNSGFIIIDKLSKKKFSIQLNYSHPLMSILIQLSYDYGENYTNNLEHILEEYF